MWIVSLSCIQITHRELRAWRENLIIFPICCCGFNIDIVTFGSQAPQWDPNNYRNSILGSAGLPLPAIGHLISIMGTWLSDLLTNVTNTSIKTTNTSLNTAPDSLQSVRCVTFQQHHRYFNRTMKHDKLLIVCSRNFPSQNWAFIFWFMDLTLGWKLRARQDLLFVASSGLMGKVRAYILDYWL